jgi:hypothetical protein
MAGCNRPSPSLEKLIAAPSLLVRSPRFFEQNALRHSSHPGFLRDLFRNVRKHLRMQLTSARALRAPAFASFPLDKAMLGSGPIYRFHLTVIDSLGLLPQLT